MTETDRSIVQVARVLEDQCKHAAQLGDLGRWPALIIVLR
jgi:hypothetical protein